MPLNPTPELIATYLRKWQRLEKYRLQEASLGLLFRSLCPENRVIQHVLLKVSALNDFYSTHVLDTFIVAKHILGMKIDTRLKKHDGTLVNAIANVSMGTKTRTFYSFASKYCNHHEPLGFPIYDSYVVKMLMHFQRSSGFGDFEKEDLKEYQRFVETIKQFQRHYKLASCSLREIDIFLWVAGKECFPRSY